MSKMKNSVKTAESRKAALDGLPFPLFIGREWKRRRADSGLFLVQPRAPPPAGIFSKFIFVAEKLGFKISNSGRTIPTLTRGLAILRNKNEF